MSIMLISPKQFIDSMCQPLIYTLLFTCFLLLQFVFLMSNFIGCLSRLSAWLCSLQVLHQRWIWKRTTSILESNVLCIQRRRGPFASFPTLLKKHLDIISSVVAMALKLKFLLLLRNGGGMCGFPFSLIIFIILQITICLGILQICVLDLYSYTSIFMNQTCLSCNPPILVIMVILDFFPLVKKTCIFSVI